MLQGLPHWYTVRRKLPHTTVPDPWHGQVPCHRSMMDLLTTYIGPCRMMPLWHTAAAICMITLVSLHRRMHSGMW